MADVLISQLPKTDAAGDSDLLIIDSFDSVSGGIVTSAIAWKDLYQKIASFPQGIKFPDGTALQPSITFVNDTNTGIYLQAPDTIGFSTSGTARLVIDPAGNLGINTLTPEEKLHISQGNLKISFGTNALVIKPADGGMSFRQTENLPLTFATNDLTRMTITNVGQILIGTSSPLSGSIVNIGSGNLQVNKATFDGEDGGITKIGNNPGVAKDLLHLNYAGAIGNTDKEYGLNGQVLTSQGEGNKWVWTNAGGGGSGVIVQPAPGPADQPVGTLWYNTDNDKLYAYDGATWNLVGDGAGGGVTPGPTPPDTPTVGDLWYDETNDVIKYWDGSEWVTLIDQNNESAGTVTSIDITDGPGIEATGGPVVDAGAITVGLKALNPDPSGTYTVTNLVVNQYGQITSASSGDAADLPAIALNDLSDVNTGTPTLNYFLKWNGSNWIADDVPVPDAVTYKGPIDLLNDAVPGGPSNGDLYINTGVGTISNNNWGAANNGVVLVGGESVYYNSSTTSWDIIVSGDSGVVKVEGNNGVAVDNNDISNPIVSLDQTYINDPANSIKNVQADYTEADPTADSFIENKPTLGTLAAEDDAASDGKLYARSNSDWVELPKGTEAGPDEPTQDLQEGQLWYDTANKQLMVYNGTDWVPVDTNVTIPPPASVGNTEPDPKEEGDLWYETDTGKFKVYADGAWVDINDATGHIESGPTPPQGPSIGDIWYDTGTDQLYVWNGSSWDEIETGADTLNNVKTTGDQTIDGVKTFLQKIEGNADRCERTVVAGAGLVGGGKLTTDINLTVDAGNGLTIDGDDVAAVAGDDTIVVDAAGIKVNLTNIFDPNNSNSVISWNNRRGAVMPVEGDYSLDLLGDVDLQGDNAPEEGDILSYQGTKFVAKKLKLDGELALQGTIDATAVTAPTAEPGQFWVNTTTGNVLNDASWGILSNVAISNNDMVAKMPDVDGQPPQWAIIGNTGGGGGGIQSVVAQNGVINQGTSSAIVLEADDTVVRVVGDQTIAGQKTFTGEVVALVNGFTGDLEGQARDCGRSVLAGDGLTGGGVLDDDVTLDLSYGTSLNIVSDKLEAPAGDGLKNGADGNGGLLSIDTDWLDTNWAPGAIPTVGDGDIGLTAGAGGGIAITGDDATANQSINTAWEIALDGTVVRTSGDQTIGGNKTFNGVTAIPIISGDCQVVGTLTSKLKLQLGTTADEGNLDFSNLPVLP